MQENADFIFHVEPPHAPGLLPTGALVLQGWVYGKAGRHAVDLRARYCGKIVPAVFGHPRADLAQYFKHHRPQLMAGFDLGLVVVPGEPRVELEALDLSGEWFSLGSHPVTAGTGPVSTATPAGPLHPFDFFRALRLLLRRAQDDADLQRLAEVLAAELPVPQVTRFPHHPFHGHLHYPAPIAYNRFGQLMVEGWLFHESLPIRRVLASYDLLAWQTMEHGGPMPYVAGMFPQFEHARHCWIRGQIDVPAQLPSPISLRVYAELADGTWELCHLQRSHVYDGEQEKKPFMPRRFLTYWHAWRSLRAACLQRGFTIEKDALFRTERQKLRREYRDRTPRRFPSASGPAVALPAGAPPAPPPRRVVIVTHNLNREGAPLFVLELAQQLAAAGTRLAVVSAADGPLRADYEGLQATVQIVDFQPLLRAESTRALRHAMTALGATVDLQAADLVIANTLSGFWGVHLARHAGRPSLFYIHESTTPDSFYYGHLAPAALPVVEETFALATHVSFLTEATRRYYRPFLTGQNHSLNPGWINLAGIDRFRAANSRADLRSRLGVDAASRLVVDIGTVCERKGPHIFVRAVEQLWRAPPALAAQCQFVVVGARHTPFDAVLVDLVQNLGRANLRIAPETSAPYEYYGAADLFVCSSYEESFPRVVLEAMAFELPILASNVHGIPEMVRAGREAELVPAGDTFALSRGLARLLQDPATGRRLAGQARARVAAEYDSVRLLPRHVALAGAIPDRRP